MCLSDTAEYWWDIKGWNSKSKHVYHHIKGVQCGHFHVYETDSIDVIDCRACKKILAEMPNIKKQVDNMLENRLYPHGKCSCGHRLVERKNHSTGETFLGCSNYPKCKKTKPIK